MELEFTIRQTHVHELNKNDMKLELASYHESTNVCTIPLETDMFPQQYAIKGLLFIPGELQKTMLFRGLR